MEETHVVTLEEVRRVAELANLELTAEEEPRMQRDLNAILGYVAALNELDTEGVAAMAQVGQVVGLARAGGQDTAAANAATDAAARGEELRVDSVRPSTERAAVMAMAPETDGRFFKVPKVIER